MEDARNPKAEASGGDVVDGYVTNMISAMVRKRKQSAEQEPYVDAKLMSKRRKHIHKTALVSSAENTPGASTRKLKLKIPKKEKDNLAETSSSSSSTSSDSD